MTDGLYDPERHRPLELDRMTRVQGLELDEWILAFNYATNPIPMNGSRGNHYAHSRKVKTARRVTEMAAKNAGIPRLERCRVQLTWCVLDKRRRDANNLAALLKAMQDGLVDAHVVPDDTPDLMDTRMSRIVRVDPMTNREAWMELRVQRWDGVFDD